LPHPLPQIVRSSRKQLGRRVARQVLCLDQLSPVPAAQAGEVIE
jgi:hypothetical protein